jgi:hypothetical protein
MKRIFTILALSLLAISSASAQSNIWKAVVGPYTNANGEIAISDPHTVIAVDYTLEKEQTIVGPYARYAMKLLGVRPSLVEKTIFSVKDVKLSVACGNALKAEAQSQENRTLVASYLGSEDEFAKISPDLMSASTISPDEAAAQAAQAIFSIRKSRNDLITGEAGENVFGGGLKDALAELDAKEQAYLELFLGKKVVKSRTERIIIPVVARVNEYPISNLIAGENKIQGITLTLTPSEATPKFSTLSEVDPRDKTAIVVRIANIATCTVKAGDKVIGSASLPIFELGRTAYIAGAVK